MSYTGNEDNSIDLEEASELTQNFRDNSASGTTIGHYFGKTRINAITAQDDCVGIRIYYGQTTTGQKQLVIVGVDSNGDDLYEGLLADKSQPCPSACSAANPLNS